MAAGEEDVLEEGGLAEDSVRNFKSNRFVECRVRRNLDEGPGALELKRVGKAETQRDGCKHESILHYYGG